MRTSENIKKELDRLDQIRFQGSDQNPYGIRDSLWFLSTRVERMEKFLDRIAPTLDPVELSDMRKIIGDHS